MSEAELEALLEVTDLQGNLAETRITFTDVTTGNASTTAHGYLRKLSGTATQYLDGSGNWSTPAGGGGGTAGITASASTTDDTVTTLWTNQLATGTSGYYKAFVTAAGDASTNVYNFTIEALVQNLSGTSAFVATNNISILPSSGTNFTAYFDLSGSNTFLKFRGLASENVNIVGTNVLVNVITNGSAAASWTPSSKSGLQWYIAADQSYTDSGVTLATADQTVAQVNDQSGNARHATQSTEASKPMFKTGIFGSKPGLLFSAAGNDHLIVPSALGTAISGTDNNFSVVIVVKPALTNSTRPVISLGGADADTLVEIGVGNGFYSGIKRDDAGTLKATSSSTTGSDLLVHCIVFNYGATTGEIYRDGVLVGAATQDIDVGATTMTTPSYVGFRAYGTSQLYDGHIGVILVYDSELSAGEIASLTTWAQANWGTP
jgi:hypothetical protein